MPGPGQFWAAPEGELGQLIGIALGHVALYHVVQSGSKPSGSANNPVYGPFTTRAEAQSKANDLNHIALAAVSAGQNTKVGPQIPNPLTGVNAIGDFFHRLTEGSTWTRVGEVVLGGILLYAGVRAMAHGSTVAGSGARSAATKPARKVAKTAVKVAVPEARLASRVAAKRIAPKTTAKVASHRQRVAKYGAKKPYQPPAPKPPRQPTVRVSHIYHHNTSPAAKPKPKPRPKKVGP